MEHVWETNEEYSARLNRQGWPNSYFGDYDNFYVFLGRFRDSGNLEESNFCAALALLGGESNDVVIERTGHWAVGWVEHISINPCNADKVAIAENIMEKLADYPILDEEDYSNREFEDYEREFDDYYSYELKEFEDEDGNISDDIIDKTREIAYDLQGYTDGIPWDMVRDKLREEME